jgi:excisionase family DNA binding protein
MTWVDKHEQTREASNMPITFTNLVLYDLQELSKKLNVHIVTLRTYLKEGRLRGQKMGTKWYVSEESLREFFLRLPAQTEKGKKERPLTPRQN